MLMSGEFPYSDSTLLLERGVVDSTGVLELIRFLEEEFGIEISDAEAVPANLDSVERLVAFVASKQVSA